MKQGNGKKKLPDVVLQKRYVRALATVCPTNDVRPYLNSVHVVGDESTVRYFASDGHSALIAWHNRDDLRSRKTPKGNPRKLRPLPGFRIAIPKAIASKVEKDSDIDVHGAVSAEIAPKSSRYDWIVGGHAITCEYWPGGAPTPAFMPEKFEKPGGDPAVVNPAILYRLHQAFALLEGRSKNYPGVVCIMVPGGGKKAQAVVPYNPRIKALGLVMPFYWDGRLDADKMGSEARACVAAMRHEDG